VEVAVSKWRLAIRIIMELTTGTMKLQL